MPIDRAEFDAGGRAQAEVMKSLEEHPDAAYTMSEIMDGVAAQGLTVDDVDAALRYLEALGMIEVKAVGDKVYYMCRRRLGFRGR